MSRYNIKTQSRRSARFGLTVVEVLYLECKYLISQWKHDVKYTR